MLEARRRACLQAMGIDLWRSKAAVEAAAEAPSDSLRPVPEKTPSGIQDAERIAASPTAELPVLDWAALEPAVANCRACGLHQARTQTVFGVGDRQASLMVVGEAPGADEDRQGEPFVGRAGQLLTAMLAACGLRRDQVYIANIIKCRPPSNRDPHGEEADACEHFLRRQIELVAPRLLLAVGRVSAQRLLATEAPVGRLRGRVHRFDYGDIPLIVTYHPAYLLRRPSEKAKVWQDLQSAHRLLNP